MAERTTVERMAEASTFTNEQALIFAENILAEHDPEAQTEAWPDRCARCDYTRHPCDAFDLAAVIVRLLKPMTNARSSDDG